MVFKVSMQWVNPSTSVTGIVPFFLQVVLWGATWPHMWPEKRSGCTMLVIPGGLGLLSWHWRVLISEISSFCLKEFLMWTSFKDFGELCSIASLLCFSFDHKACEILVPQPRIQSAPLHWKVKFLTTGPPEVQLFLSYHELLLSPPTWWFWNFIGTQLMMDSYDSWSLDPWSSFVPLPSSSVKELDFPRYVNFALQI